MLAAVFRAGPRPLPPPSTKGLAVQMLLDEWTTSVHRVISPQKGPVMTLSALRNTLRRDHTGSVGATLWDERSGSARLTPTPRDNSVCVEHSCAPR